MKKLISIVTVVAFLSTVSMTAQEKAKETAKKEVAKTEKKSCAKEDGKRSCCSAKKTEVKTEVVQ